MAITISDDKVHIVMIEDDDGHARLIEKNLRRAGIMNPLIHYSQGKEALNYFFSETPERNLEKTLILLDLNLPDIDGFEILKQLREDKRTHAIPVIILTTTDNPREINRCYELGCNIYITKPVEYQDFCDAIAKLGMMLAVVKIPNIHT